MTAEELDWLLEVAKKHGDVVLWTPPGGFELVKWSEEEYDEED